MALNQTIITFQSSNIILIKRLIPCYCSPNTVDNTDEAVSDSDETSASALISSEICQISV